MPLLELELNGALRGEGAACPARSRSSSTRRSHELERRLRERATESAGEIGERIALAGEQKASRDEFDYVVENDERERAADECVAIVERELATAGYHGPPMIHPRIDELLDQVDSRYALVIVAAKRARQINNYHHQLGEGTFDEFAPPLVESRSKNYLTLALEEIAEGKITYDYRALTRRRHNAAMSRDPPRRHRRDRRLQGVRGHAAARQARARRVPLVTPGAERFVRAETFAALARRPAGEDLYPHLTRADLLVVAPCTANTLAKLAHGLADNVLTEAALAHRGPVLVAPAMNPRMWAHAATRANVETLRAPRRRARRARRGRDRRGRVGRRPDGRAGARSSRARRSCSRRRASPAAACSSPRAARASRVDSVRFVGNRSSGRMGVALAEEARRRGAEVVLLAANLAVPAPAGVETIPTPTAETMLEAALALADVDLALLAAAVADYRPAAALAGKRAKGGGAVDARARADAPTSRARSASASGRARCSSSSAPSSARTGSSASGAMLDEKNADLVVYNDVSRADIGFDATENEVVLDRPRRRAPRPEGGEAGASPPRSSTRPRRCSRE